MITITYTAYGLAVLAGASVGFVAGWRAGRARLARIYRQAVEAVARQDRQR